MTPEHLALLSGWTVETVETSSSEVRLLLRRNNRRREAVVRGGVLHVADLHYVPRGADLRVYRTWHSFADAVVDAVQEHPLTVSASSVGQPQALGVTCEATGKTLWVGLSTLRRHMVETEPDLPLSSEGYHKVLTRLCVKRGSLDPVLAAARS